MNRRDFEPDNDRTRESIRLSQSRRIEPRNAKIKRIACYILRVLIAILAISLPIAMIVAYNRCPIHTVTGPDFEDFMTIVGFKNEVKLTLSSTDSRCGAIDEFDLGIKTAI